MGLSGKIRIQIRPPRFIWRVIARRAASICLAVKRPRPTALRPYSPKLTLAPRAAMPLLRPFCCLRYFVLAGCCIVHSWLYWLLCRLCGGFLRTSVRLSGSFLLTSFPIRSGLCPSRLPARRTPRFRFSRAGRHLRCRCPRTRLLPSTYHSTFEYPDLDSGHAIGCLGLRDSVIEIGPQCMKG